GGGVGGRAGARSRLRGACRVVARLVAALTLTRLTATFTLVRLTAALGLMWLGVALWRVRGAGERVGTPGRIACDVGEKARRSKPNAHGQRDELAGHRIGNYPRQRKPPPPLPPWTP